MRSTSVNGLLGAALVVLAFAFAASGQAPATDKEKTAGSVLARAIQTMGGDRYLNVKTQVGKGKYSVIKGDAVVSFQSFIDIFVFPDKERTDFKGQGAHTVQANTGETGWVFDGAQELIKTQNETQVANFRQALRTSLDHLLRGNWKGEAELTYVGKRPATLGKRNDVVKLTYKDDFAVEFEFAVDDGLPQKAIYSRTNPDGEIVKEEDRYAQFIEIDGVMTPFIIDKFSAGTRLSRINYESVEFNRPISESIFAKPSSTKDAKKDPKY